MHNYIHTFYFTQSHKKILVLFPWGKSQGMKHEFQGAVVYTRGSQTRFSNNVSVRGRKRPLWVWPWALFHFPRAAVVYLF